MAKASDVGKADWLCKSCVGRNGEPFRNHGHRTACFMCRLSKGVCFGKKVEPGPPKSQLTFAERQVRLQKAEEAHRKALKDKDAELLKLRAELAAAKGNEVPPSVVATGTTKGEGAAKYEEQKDVEAELAKARETLRRLENTPEDMREFLQKTVEQLVAEQKTLVRALDAKRRGLKPMDDQLRQSRAHLTNLQERHAKELKATEGTEKTISELRARLVEQQAKAAATLVEVERAKVEYAQLSQAVAAAATSGTGALPATAAATTAPNSSEATVVAVKGYLQGLPQAVATDPQGQQAIQQVLDLLGKLDDAAKAVASAAAIEAAAKEDSMEFDDDLLDQMAEAAVAPAENGEPEADERKKRVAEAKARVNSKKVDLANGLARVKATIKK